MKFNINEKFNNILNLKSYLNIYYIFEKNYDVEFIVELMKKYYVFKIKNYEKYHDEFDDDIIYLISNNFNIVEIIENNDDVEIYIKRNDLNEN